MICSMIGFSLWKRLKVCILLNGCENRCQDQKETSECILQWNYYGKVGKFVKTILTNAEEDAKGEFRHNSIFIKISPEDVFKSFFLKLPSCMPIDVCACFKRLYSRSEVKKESS